MEALFVHRFQFAFTSTFHYLFPQLTMGLALLIFVLKTRALRGDEDADRAARFWLKIFGVTFVMGVVTGIPLEFQFGTNWARFSAAAGGVIGQTLAMEGVFAFFLESCFLYVLLFGERRVGPRGHWAASLLLFVGTWLSGYFIVFTNAWMQHPVGFELAADGTVVLTSLAALLTNPWGLAQYVHTMLGAAITGSFVMAGIGALYTLRGLHEPVARLSLTTGVAVGLVASLLAAFPAGDIQAKMVHDHQPVTFAAMEGHFESAETAPLVILGQPNMRDLRLDNPLIVPGFLSILTHKRWNARIAGLNEFGREEWPDNVPLLYYSYHIMVGLGTFFIAIMGLSAFLLWRMRLRGSPWMLWVLLLAMPFPFVANTTGWLTAELGRQPWVIHGVMRTAVGSSLNVSSGNALFTLLGFMGLYALMAALYLILTLRIIAHGPDPADPARAGERS